MPRYNRSCDDIILTVTMNRLLIICAEHYAREKVSDLKMNKLIIRQEKTFESNLTRKTPEEEARGRKNASHCERQMVMSVPTWKSKG